MLESVLSTVNSAEAIDLTSFLLCSGCSLLLGLIAVMPMLGHASWHAYRDLVDASSLPERDLTAPARQGGDAS